MPAFTGIVPPSCLQRILAVQGQLLPEEAELLYELARDACEGCIVEVGSFRGRSATALVLGTRAGSHVPVYAIEPHETFVGILGGKFGPADRKAFFENTLRADVVETIRLVNVSSDVITPGWERPVALLWLDGDHTYEGVTRDFRCWRPHLAPHAVVALHDSNDPKLGPARLIDEIVASGDFAVEARVGLSTVLRRG
jgi:hypothetical protein